MSYENFLQLGSTRWTTPRASFIRGDSFDAHLGLQSMSVPQTTPSLSLLIRRASRSHSVTWPCSCHNSAGRLGEVPA